ISNQNARPVAGNDVARRARPPYHGIERAEGDVQADSAVAYADHAGRIGADEIALNAVVADSAADRDSVSGVAGHDVSGAGDRSAYRVGRCPGGDEDGALVSEIRDRSGAADVGANEVPLNHIARCSGARDGDAGIKWSGVAGDKVSRAAGRSADGVVR